MDGVTLGVTYNGALLKDTAMIVVKSGSLADTLTVYGNATAVIEVATLRALRDSVHLFGGSATRYYRVTGEVVVSATSTNRNQKWVQDATAGILIDDASNKGGMFDVGDGITGMVGAVTLYGRLMQFAPYIRSASITSTGNTVDAITLTVAEYAANIDKYESRLIRVNELTWKSSGTFASNQSYNTVDADEDTMVIRTAIYQADYIGEAIPVGRYDITGIAGRYAETVQMTPRSLSDIVSNPVAGVSDMSNALRVAVYPNPSDGRFNVSVADGTLYEIINLQGRVVGSGVISGSKQLQVRTSGIYMLRLIDSKGKVSTGRIVVK
jgi:hypothetical protein